MSDLEVKIDSDLCQIEETFSYMEHLSDNNDMSRPDSNVSFSSWTFSPITEEMSDNSSTQSGDVTKSVEVSTVQQELPPLQPQSSHQQMCANYQPVNSLQQMTYPYDHYGHPNAVYHHSVNIHNYNVGPQAWSYDPVTYSVYNFNVPQVPQTEYSVDHHDPLASFNVQDNNDFARCSTPEYIMALNSLQQCDTPPPIQSTTKALPDCSYAPKIQPHSAPVPKPVDLNKQDSGYNSDLDASPVIDYQDNHVKIPKVNQISKKAMCTSTPAMYPVLRMASMIKDSRQMVPRRLISPSVPGVLSMPGFVPKIYAGNQQSFARSARVSQVANSLRQIQSEEISSSIYQRQNSIRFTSIADYEAAKKRMSQEKRKADQVSNDNTENSQADESVVKSDLENQPMKRRRHNEPLNYMALQVMNNWYDTHLDNPYPTKEQKDQLAKEGGITVAQVKSWFANKRNRSNNTRPKKQRKVMEDQLMNICHQLAQDARKPNKDNAYYIQQLSSIIDTTKQSMQMNM